MCLHGGSDGGDGGEGDGDGDVGDGDVGDDDGDAGGDRVLVVMMVSKNNDECVCECMGLCALV